MAITLGTAILSGSTSGSSRTPIDPGLSVESSVKTLSRVRNYGA
jgi:hypothetical protein